MTIEITTQNRVTTMVINRPEKRNAITQDMYATMADAITSYGDSDTARAMIITGAEDYFTSGNDIRDFAIGAREHETPPVGRFLRAILECPKPLIAAVNGPGIGIGVTMLLHCDVVLAAEEASFSTPFTQLGLVPEAASSVLLPAVVGMAVANDMFLAGRVLTAEEALRHGLVSRVVPGADLAQLAADIAAQMAAMPPKAMQLSKGLIRAGRAQIAAQMDAEAVHFTAQLQASEFAEVVAAKMQKRTPKFD